MDLGLAGKVVIVTGAGRSIGRQIALAFAQERASVVVNDVDASTAEATLSDVLRSTENALAIPADVSSYGDIKKMVEQAEAEFGRVDVLVNNAAAFLKKAFVETDYREWAPVIKVDLVGIMNTVHCVLPGMIERRYGRIVNISSDAGKVGQANNAVYSAAKAGANGFVKAIAREVGRYDITVNAVSPGIVKTPRSQEIPSEREERIVKLYPLRRLGRMDDIAEMVLFLASDRASYITGQTISVSGGFSMQ